MGTQTGKKVIARVTEYDGDYITHGARTQNILDNVLKISPAFDVQDVLGDNASE